MNMVKLSHTQGAYAKEVPCTYSFLAYFVSFQFFPNTHGSVTLVNDITPMAEEVCWLCHICMHMHSSRLGCPAHAGFVTFVYCCHTYGHTHN